MRRITVTLKIKLLELYGISVKDRPKKLLVLINPVSGRCKGLSVYNSKIAPVFKEAKVETDVIGETYFCL